MKQQNYKQHAFTLMELLVVLLLISAIILASRAIYQKYILQQDITVVQQNIEQLFNILDRSYFALSSDDQKICASKINNSIVLPDNSTDWKFILPSNLVPQTGSPKHPNFIISCINPSTNTPAKLVIQSPLNVSTDQLAWYAERLGGIKDGTNVKWQKIPSFTNLGKDALWIIGGQIEEFKSLTTLPKTYLTLQIGNVPTVLGSNSVEVMLTYDAGSGPQTVGQYTDQWNTTTLKFSLPDGTRSINIKKITIKCNNAIVSSVGSINSLLLVNNNITVSVFFNLNNIFPPTPIQPLLSVNSRLVSGFNPPLFAACRST